MSPVFQKSRENPNSRMDASFAALPVLGRGLKGKLIAVKTNEIATNKAKNILLK